jgi:hypothetical protein
MASWYAYCPFTSCIFSSTRLKGPTGNEEGFLRLKTLVRAITISRTKKVIRLAPREDFVYHPAFTQEELELYENIKKRTIPLIRSALSSDQGRKQVNALQHLNNFRLICSHGRLAQSILQPTNQLISNTELDAQESVLTGALDTNSTCNNCGRDILEDLLEGPPSASLDSQLNSIQRSKGVCEQCILQIPQAGFTQWFSADLLEIPLTPLSQSPTPSVEGDRPLAPPIELMPTKIKALLADLAEHSSQEKR